MEGSHPEEGEEEVGSLAGTRQLVSFGGCISCGKECGERLRRGGWGLISKGLPSAPQRRSPGTVNVTICGKKVFAAVIKPRL